MLKLVKVEKRLRDFTLYSLFVADEDDMKQLERWCREGRVARFGEIAGKHSDVNITFQYNDFQVVSEDERFIEKFVDVVGLNFGTYVFDAFLGWCPQCGEVMEEDDVDVCKPCREQNEGESSQ